MAANVVPRPYRSTAAPTSARSCVLKLLTFLSAYTSGTSRSTRAERPSTTTAIRGRATSGLGRTWPQPVDSTMSTRGQRRRLGDGRGPLAYLSIDAEARYADTLVEETLLVGYADRGAATRPPNRGRITRGMAGPSRPQPAVAEGGRGRDHLRRKGPLARRLGVRSGTDGRLRLRLLPPLGSAGGQRVGRLQAVLAPGHCLGRRSCGRTCRGMTGPDRCAE